MQVSSHKVVAIDYTLKNDDGEVIDTSQGKEPLAYLHGKNNIIPGLESALEGKSVGDEVQVTVAPQDAYGEHSVDLIQEVDRANFADVPDLAVGMQFRLPTTDGESHVVTLTELDDATVTLDGNHPLAGVTLHFQVAIRDVREATPEELEHGHAH